MMPAGHAPPSRPCTPTGCAPPRRPARAAVRLVGRDAHARRDHHAEGGRERAARAAGDRRLDQRAHPPDRDRRPRSASDVDLQALNELSATRRRCWSTSSPPAQHYMEDFYAAGGMGAVLRELRPLLHLDCLTVTGETLGERLDAAAVGPVDRDVDPAAAPSRSSRRAGSSRCSASWRRAAPSSSARPPTPALFEREGRAVVFDVARGPGGAHRRSGARRDARRLPGAAERRPARAAGHARGRLPADPGEARARGRQGHGAHLRRAHERHRLRHGRAARRARGRVGRAAGAGAERRPHPPQRRASDASTCWSDAELAPASEALAPPAPPARGYARLYAAARAAGAEGCDFDFLRPAR